jgi:hypothetical protein
MTGPPERDEGRRGGDPAERLRQHLRARFSEEEVEELMPFEEGREEAPDPPPDEREADDSSERGGAERKGGKRADA